MKNKVYINNYKWFFKSNSLLLFNTKLSTKQLLKKKETESERYLVPKRQRSRKTKRELNVIVGDSQTDRVIYRKSFAFDLNLYICIWKFYIFGKIVEKRCFIILLMSFRKILKANTRGILTNIVSSILYVSYQIFPACVHKYLSTSIYLTLYINVYKHIKYLVTYSSVERTGV